MNTVLGIDVGATSVKAALFDAADRDRAVFRRETTDHVRTAVGLTACIADIRAEADAAARSIGIPPPAAVGMGMPAVYDKARGVVTRSPNAPGWDGFAVRDALRAALTLPVAVDNDVNTIAWGELSAGAARGRDRFLLLVLGTGLGGAWAVNGTVQGGDHGMAGEFGHIGVAGDGGRPCGCGNRGCVEAYVSQVGLAAGVAERLAAGAGPAFAAALAPAPRAEVPERLGALAAAGDADALAVLNDAGYRLGTALGILLTIFDFEAVLIGGGVARLLPYMRPSLLPAVRRRTFDAPAAAMQLIETTLGDRAGMVGGARLARLALSEGSP